MPLLRGGNPSTVLASIAFVLSVALASAQGNPVSSCHLNAVCASVGDYSTIAGGTSNTVNAAFGVVSGGEGGKVSAAYGVVAGGQDNTVLADYSVIAGGEQNTITLASNITNITTGECSTISGGRSNVISGLFPDATISGGRSNSVVGSSSTISGGAMNKVIGGYSTVGGGVMNTALGEAASLAGGLNNACNGFGCTVGGGGGLLFDSNVANGNYSTIPGGKHNTVNGFGGVALGSNTLVAFDHAAVFGFQTDGSVCRAEAAGSISFCSSGGFFLNQQAIFTGPEVTEIIAAVNASLVAADNVLLDLVGVTDLRVQVAEGLIGNLQLYLAENASLVKGLTSTSTNHSARIQSAEIALVDHSNRIVRVESNVTEMNANISNHSSRLGAIEVNLAGVSVSTLSSQIAVLGTGLQNLTEEIEAVSALLPKISVSPGPGPSQESESEALQTLQSRINVAETSVQNLERYAATNFTVLTSVAETVDAHGVRIAVAEFDVYHLQLYLAKNASLVKGLTSTSTNHAARIAFAESNVTDHAGRIDSLEEGVSKVWSSIVFLEDGFENLTAELNSLVAAADAPQPDDGTATAIAANISLLQSTMSSIQSNVQQLERHLESNSTSLATLSSTFGAAITAASSSLTDRIESLEEELASVSLGNLSNEVASAESHVESLYNNFNDAKRALVSLNQTVSTAALQVEEDIQRFNETLFNARTTVDFRLDTMEQHLSMCNCSHAADDDASDQPSDLVLQLQATVEQHENTIASLVSDVSQYEDTVEKLEGTIVGLSANLTALTDIVSSLIQASSFAPTTLGRTTLAPIVTSITSVDCGDDEDLGFQSPCDTTPVPSTSAAATAVAADVSVAMGYQYPIQDSVESVPLAATKPIYMVAAVTQASNTLEVNNFTFTLHSTECENVGGDDCVVWQSVSPQPYSTLNPGSSFVPNFDVVYRLSVVVDSVLVGSGSPHVLADDVVNVSFAPPPTFVEVSHTLLSETPLARTFRVSAVVDTAVEYSFDVVDPPSSWGVNVGTQSSATIVFEAPPTRNAHFMVTATNQYGSSSSCTLSNSTSNGNATSLGTQVLCPFVPKAPQSSSNASTVVDDLLNLIETANVTNPLWFITALDIVSENTDATANSSADATGVLLDSFVGYMESAATEPTTESVSADISVLSQFADAVTPSSKEAVSSLVKGVSAVTHSIAFAGDAAVVQDFTRAISMIASLSLPSSSDTEARNATGITVTNEASTTTQTLTDAVDAACGAVLDGTPPNEIVTFEETAFQAACSKGEADSGQTAELGATGTGMDFLTNAMAGLSVVSLVTWSDEQSAAVSTAATSATPGFGGLASNVYSVTVLGSGSSVGANSRRRRRLESVADEDNVDKGFVMDMAATIPAEEARRKALSCSYFAPDRGNWSSSGMIVRGFRYDGTVSCLSSHLTLMGAQDTSKLSKIVEDQVNDLSSRFQTLNDVELSQGVTVQSPVLAAMSICSAVFLVTVIVLKCRRQHDARDEALTAYAHFGDLSKPRVIHGTEFEAILRKHITLAESAYLILLELACHNGFFSFFFTFSHSSIVYSKADEAVLLFAQIMTTFFVEALFFDEATEPGDEEEEEWFWLVVASLFEAFLATLIMLPFDQLVPRMIAGIHTLSTNTSVPRSILHKQVSKLMIKLGCKKSETESAAAQMARKRRRRTLEAGQLFDKTFKTWGEIKQASSSNVLNAESSSAARKVFRRANSKKFTKKKLTFACGVEVIVPKPRHLNRYTTSVHISDMEAPASVSVQPDQLQKIVDFQRHLRRRSKFQRYLREVEFNEWYTNCRTERMWLRVFTFTGIAIVLGFCFYCCILFSAILTLNECELLIITVLESLAIQFLVTAPMLDLVILSAQLLVAAVLLNNDKRQRAKARDTEQETHRRDVASSKKSNKVHSLKSVEGLMETAKPSPKPVVHQSEEMKVSDVEDEAMDAY